MWIEAKAAHPGEFIAWIEADLPFDARNAQLYMKMAADPQYTDVKHASHRPPDVTAFASISQAPI